MYLLDKQNQKGNAASSYAKVVPNLGLGKRAVYFFDTRCIWFGGVGLSLNY